MSRSFQPGASLSVVRRDPAARAIVAQWRRLTTPEDEPTAGRGAATLVAISGGADSTALLLALAASRADIVAAHIVHDLRPRAEAHADRDAVVQLCQKLGVRLEVRSVRPRVVGGNAEAAARRLRYAALARVAREAGVSFVATGHHAHDQLETVLMRLARGAGPRGQAGIAPSRRLTQGVTLIRPMLGVTPGEARRVCELAGVRWREDLTNRDLTRTRAAIRSLVLPPLLKIAPQAARRASAGAALQHDAAISIDAAARRVNPRAAGWARAELRSVDRAVLSAFWRLAAAARGARLDRAGARSIGGLTRYVRSRGTDPKSFSIGGVVFAVTARRVEAGLPVGAQGRGGRRA